jgi:hypothetical protein
MAVVVEDTRLTEVCVHVVLVQEQVLETVLTEPVTSRTSGNTHFLNFEHSRQGAPSQTVV